MGCIRLSAGFGVRCCQWSRLRKTGSCRQTNQVKQHQRSWRLRKSLTRKNLMQAIRTSRRLRGRWITLWWEDRRRARAATHAGPTVPNAPANLIGQDLVTYIQLDWQDMSSNELGFRLYRKVDSGGF